MILTCPECATRYFVDDHKVGPAGRTVRCASCGSAWKALAEEPLELTAAAEDGGFRKAAAEPLSFKPVDAAPEKPAEPARAFRAKAEQRRKLREAAVAGVVWAGVAGCFVALLAGAYVFRVDVVKLYPRAAGAYAMAGLPVNPTGLEFEQIKAESAPDGLAAVTVSGLVRNVEDAASVPPPLRVALVDRAGKKLATTVVTLPAAPLSPGQARSFSVSLPDPDAATADVEVNFAMDLAPKPAPKAKRPPAKPTATPLRVAQARPATTTPTAAQARLRPTLGLPPSAPTEDARPLAAGDPYALDSTPGRAVSAAPHG
jgi:predicted Zn finger-like uncharacterized protein